MTARHREWMRVEIVTTLLLFGLIAAVIATRPDPCEDDPVKVEREE